MVGSKKAVAWKNICESSYTYICPGFLLNPFKAVVKNKTTSRPMDKAGLSTWRPNTIQRTDLPEKSCNMKDLIDLLVLVIIILSTFVTTPKRLVQKGPGMER